MLRTESYKRTISVPSKNRSNIKQRKNIIKGVQRKSTPYMFGNNSLSIKGQLVPNKINTDLPLEYYLNKSEYIKSIIKYYKNGVDFKLNKFNDIEVYNIVENLKKDGFKFHIDESNCYILKEYDKKQIGGYGCELSCVYNLKKSHTKEYELLVGCLSLLRSKIILFSDYCGFEHYKEIIEEEDKELLDDDENHESYCFKDMDDFIFDIENTNVSLSLIKKLIKNNNYPLLTNIFKITVKMLKYEESIYRYIYRFEDYADPSPFLLFFWNFEDRLGMWLDVEVNSDYSNYEQNWLNIEIGNDDKYIDLYFELLNEFYSIDEKITS